MTVKKKTVKKATGKKPAPKPASKPAADPLANRLWFKVLVGGRSCHGGSLDWSLPADGKPGGWHEMPAPTPLFACRTGFHLTDKPAEWMLKDAQVYVAEWAGERTEYAEDGHKIAVRKCRLLRPATGDELAAVGVYTAGTHDHKSGRAWASGSSKVTAYDSSQVTAYDSSQVTAYDSSKVTAYDSSKVTASGSSKVTAYDSSQVTAYDSSQVTAYDSSQVTASGSSKVTAYDSSQVTAKDRVTVMKQVRRVVVSLMGLAVEVDWSGERAEFRRADLEGGAE